MRLAIDFDHVIHDPSHRLPGYQMGQPVVGATQALAYLTDQGHTIIVHTARTELSHVRDWLDFFSVPYHDVTSTKPDAEWYIDDKGLRFESWHQVLDALDG